MSYCSVILERGEKGRYIIAQIAVQIQIDVWLAAPNIQSNSFTPLLRHQRYQRRAIQRVAADHRLDTIGLAQSIGCQHVLGRVAEQQRALVQ